jgi:hypothetical protein
MYHYVQLCTLGTLLPVLYSPNHLNAFSLKHEENKYVLIMQANKTEVCLYYSNISTALCKYKRKLILNI